MRKALVPKPQLTVNNNPMINNESDNFDDDYFLDDPDDDLICSQFDVSILETQPLPPQQAQPQVQPQQPSNPVQPPPPGLQFKKPLGPFVPRQSTPNPSFTRSIVKPSDSRYDQLVGENCMLKEKLENIKKQLQEESKSKQEMRKEMEQNMAELKDNYEKKLNNIQAVLDFEKADYATLKMKVNELERQLKIAKSQLDNSVIEKPLPYSLPIVMHRTLDFSSDKGFVDWCDTATSDDIPD